jgi:hypothetical protein
MKFIISKKNQKYILVFIAGIALLLPLGIALRNILSGSIPFWYDNARDLLSAWDNLNKPTLIGPTSGIPGIFYGPYWIWFLSIGLIFSKDPRIANIVVGIIPMFLIVPLVLYKFRKIFEIKILLIIWLLFIFSTGMNYATYMWNPHVAPSLILLLMYLLMFTDNVKKDWPNLFKTILTGLTAGLIINFHISLGIGIILGTIIFYVIDGIIALKLEKKNRKNSIINKCINITLFLFGALMSFTPFLLFEVRHGFNQVQSAINAFTKYGDVVVLKGLTKTEILQHFIGRPSEFLKVNNTVVYLLEIIAIIYILMNRKSHKVKLEKNEAKLLAVLFALSTGILLIYLTARNPVLHYHFIGTEIIFLLLLAFVIQKIPVLKYLLTAWVIFLVISYLVTFARGFNMDPRVLSSLSTKEYITDIVAGDAGGNPYTVFNNSPSIYQYEYTYLFKWRYKVDVPYDPGNNPNDSYLVYIISPEETEEKIKGYINYRAPDKKYKTVKSWTIADGTTIYKRISITSDDK